MQLTFHGSDDSHSVRQITESGVQVGENLLSRSFILTPDTIVPDWPIPSVDQLTEAAAEMLLAHEPELVVIGTGDSLVFPYRSFQFALLRQGVGVECMDNHAACRTFNVLVSEQRRVVMGLILNP